MRIFIRLQSVDKRFGHKIIFEDASLSIGEGQKIGVIGRNGAGKSTLCKMICGEEEVDEGELVLSNQLILAYLKQHSEFLEDDTVEKYLIRKTNQPEWVCGRIAADFQLKSDLFNRVLISTFSGGYQTRVRLVEMLLQEPNFLILDEPTNYLDLHTQILLEEFLKRYKGGYLVVSHDREFLSKTCDLTLEAERGKLVLYPGKIENWLLEKEGRQEHAQRHNQNVLAKQKQLETFIAKNKAKAFGASQARNKQKQLDRLQTKEIERPLPEVRIKIPHVEQLKGNALQCLNMSIGYDDKIIADEINLTFLRGSKVGIVGENGQGKTTFLKSLSGDLSLLSGAFKWGAHIRVGYYAQHVFQSISGSQTIYDYLSQNSLKEHTHQDILQMAGNFLFRDEDLEKKIGVLSGGEKARLCLAGILLNRYDVLILDEPNNHLDFETVEALSRSLKGFNGTVFFVSHDRQFVRYVANHIIEVKRGHITSFRGSYDDYIYAIEQELISDRPVVANIERAEPKKESPKASQVKLDYHEVKKWKSELRKKEKSLDELEKRKDLLEKEMINDPSACTTENLCEIDKLTSKIPLIEEEILELMSKVDG